MTMNVIYRAGGRIFIVFSALSLVYVAVMAMIHPQSVMDMVGVKLTNTDAISSIRGIYGGVGITIFILLLYLAFYHIGKGIVFLIMFWGSYAASRLITWVVDGPLGDFGANWLLIETFLSGVGLILLLIGRKIKSN
ncbi:MAG: DUF4345 domain-containing protein [Cyclobacteriaceae bacterium]|nr:DUF4345 domain-containing protein [Cyclobacteriaceae bacterium]